MKQIRVLQVVTILNRGGEETMIMNYYRKMNRNEIQFDFLTHRSEVGDYEEEIRTMGGRIYRAFPIRPWSYKQYQKWLDVFFQEHKNEFAAVHAHLIENSGFVLEAARKAGIPVRIAHSHAAMIKYDYKYPFRLYGKHILKKSGATHYLACGADAGKYLYGDADFEVLPNAVDLDLFAYNPILRAKVREELSVDSRTTVIGHVASFQTNKNQTFLVDVFNSYNCCNPDSVLVMVGVGPEQERVREKVEKLGLSNRVFFLNVRSDVYRILQAFDIFVFPSIREGLPLSIVEAQASGLPCLVSNTIPKESAITGLVDFEDLHAGAERWAAHIEEKLKGFTRINTNQILEKAGYDINDNTKRLINIYQSQQ